MWDFPTSIIPDYLCRMEYTGLLACVYRANQARKAQLRILKYNGEPISKMINLTDTPHLHWTPDAVLIAASAIGVLTFYDLQLHPTTSANLLKDIADTRLILFAATHSAVVIIGDCLTVVWHNKGATVVISTLSESPTCVSVVHTCVPKRYIIFIATSDGRLHSHALLNDALIATETRDLGDTVTRIASTSETLALALASGEVRFYDIETEGLKERGSNASLMECTTLSNVTWISTSAILVDAMIEGMSTVFLMDHGSSTRSAPLGVNLKGFHFPDVDGATIIGKGSSYKIQKIPKDVFEFHNKESTSPAVVLCHALGSSITDDAATIEMLASIEDLESARWACTLSLSYEWNISRIKALLECVSFVCGVKGIKCGEAYIGACAITRICKSIRDVMPITIRQFQYLGVDAVVRLLVSMEHFGYAFRVAQVARRDLVYPVSVWLKKMISNERLQFMERLKILYNSAGEESLQNVLNVGIDLCLKSNKIQTGTELAKLHPRVESRVCSFLKLEAFEQALKTSLLQGPSNTLLDDALYLIHQLYTDDNTWASVVLDAGKSMGLGYLQRAAHLACTLGRVNAAAQLCIQNKTPTNAGWYSLRDPSLHAFAIGYFGAKGEEGTKYGGRVILEQMDLVSFQNELLKKSIDVTGLSVNDTILYLLNRFDDASAVKVGRLCHLPENQYQMLVLQSLANRGKLEEVYQVGSSKGALVRAGYVVELLFQHKALDLARKLIPRLRGAEAAEWAEKIGAPSEGEAGFSVQKNYKWSIL